MTIFLDGFQGGSAHGSTLPPFERRRAQEGTASHVETLVRKYRRASRIVENERAEAGEAARGLRTWFDADGMLVVEGRLMPEQGALLTKALDRTRDALYSQPEVSAETPGEEGTGNEVQRAAQDKSSHSMRLADALALMAERSLAAEAAEQRGGDRFQVVVHVDQEVLANPDADGRSELEEGPAISPDTVRRLGCDGSVSVMLHTEAGDLRAGRKSRVISAPLRRALRARDGARCAFPGCTCRARDAHHVQHWADGGPTVLENLVGLCRRHHTLVHEGHFRVDVRPDGGFRFLDTRGRELLPAPPLPAVERDPVAELGARWLGPDAEMDPQRGVPTWEGESFDYEWALEALRARAGMGLEATRGWRERRERPTAS